MIFIDPDELGESSKVKDILRGLACPGLESKTGADFVVSRLPISLDDIDWHIANGSLFVQRKSGFDFASFDNLHESIARMQKLRIPQSQRILLFIGQATEEIGKLLINGEISFQGIGYDTFLTIKAMWRLRGGFFDQIPGEGYLPNWIEAQEKAINKAVNEPVREIYTSQVSQEIKSIDPNDWRYIMVAGLKGFGAKKANLLQEYMTKNHYPSNLYFALLLLTEADEKGKPVHNIPEWGQKSFEELRLRLGLVNAEDASGKYVYNLTMYDLYNSNDFISDFLKTVDHTIDHVIELANSGVEGLDALEKTKADARRFFLKE